MELVILRWPLKNQILILMLLLLVLTIAAITLANIRTISREDDHIVVSIPVNFRRRNGRKTIIANPDNGSDESNENATMIAAIAKAWAWQEELESGQFGSIEELAEAKKVGRTYASRILRLTSLCPELVESILAGNAPEGLSLRKLHKGIPDCWDQQKELFGFV